MFGQIRRHAFPHLSQTDERELVLRGVNVRQKEKAVRLTCAGVGVAGLPCCQPFNSALLMLRLLMPKLTLRKGWVRPSRPQASLDRPSSLLPPSLQAELFGSGQSGRVETLSSLSFCSSGCEGEGREQYLPVVRIRGIGEACERKATSLGGGAEANSPRGEEGPSVAGDAFFLLMTV